MKFIAQLYIPRSFYMLAKQRIFKHFLRNYNVGFVFKLHHRKRIGASFLTSSTDMFIAPRLETAQAPLRRAHKGGGEIGGSSAF
jgi:hypothetical protein